MGSEFWTIRNIPSRFGCYKRCLKTAQNIAKARGIDVILEHHGPRPNPNRDHTRVHQWVRIDGRVDITIGDGGSVIDV